MSGWVNRTDSWSLYDTHSWDTGSGENGSNTSTMYQGSWSGSDYVAVSYMDASAIRGNIKTWTGLSALYAHSSEDGYNIDLQWCTLRLTNIHSWNSTGINVVTHSAPSSGGTVSDYFDNYNQAEGSTYAHSGSINLAYQLIDSGATDYWIALKAPSSDYYNLDYYGYFQGGSGANSGNVPLFTVNYSWYNSYTAPPSAPTNLQVTGYNDYWSTASVSWTSPGGTISGYYVYWSGDNVHWNLDGTVASGTTTYEFTDLTPSTQYYFMVQAYNSGGSSGNSNSASGLTYPGLATSLASSSLTDNSVTLTWVRPGAGCGPFTGYYIYANGTLVDTVADGTLTDTITGLSPNTSYTFGIATYNDTGTLGTSSTITVVSVSGAGAVAGVTGAAIAGSVSTGWVLPGAVASEAVGALPGVVIAGTGKLLGGAVGADSAAAVAGSVSAGTTITGPVAGSAAAASGNISRGSTITGTVASASSAAPVAPPARATPSSGPVAGATSAAVSFLLTAEQSYRDAEGVTDVVSVGRLSKPANAVGLTDQVTVRHSVDPEDIEGITDAVTVGYQQSIAANIGSITASGIPGSVSTTSGGTPIGTTRAGWNVYNSVTSTPPAMKWNTAQRLSSTTSFAWRDRVAVSSTTSFAWWTLLHKYNIWWTNWAILQTKKATTGPAWNVAERISSSRSFGWNTIGRLASTMSMAWKVTNRDTLGPSEAFANWNVLKRQSSTASFSWKVAQRKDSTASFAWLDKLQFRSNAKVAWNTLEHFRTTAQSAWNVGILSASSTKQFSWKDRQRLSHSAAASWTTRARYAQSALVRWNTMARKDATTAADWQVLNAATSTVSSAWNTVGRLSATTSATWRDDARVRTIAFVAWNVGAREASTTTVSWDVQWPRAHSSWNVRQRISASLSCAFNVAKDLTPVTATTSSQWKVRKRISSSTSCAWNVGINSATSTNSIKWKVLKRVSSTAGFGWKTENRWGTEVLIKWNTMNDVTSTATMEWNVGAPTQTGMRLLPADRWIQTR